MSERTIKEQHTFSRDEINEILKQIARMNIIGNFYKGEFGEQTITHAEDGTVTVVTTHTPEPR